MCSRYLFSNCEHRNEEGDKSRSLTKCASSKRPETPRGKDAASSKSKKKTHYLILVPLTLNIFFDLSFAHPRGLQLV